MSAEPVPRLPTLQPMPYYQQRPMVMQQQVRFSPQNAQFYLASNLQNIQSNPMLASAQLGARMQPRQITIAPGITAQGATPVTILPQLQGRPVIFGAQPQVRPIAGRQMLAVASPRPQTGGAPTLLMMPNMQGMVGSQGAAIVPVRA